MKNSFCSILSLVSIQLNILIFDLFIVFNMVSGANKDIVITAVREHHQQSMVKAILSITTLILKEKVSQPLLDVILQNLLKEGKVNMSLNVFILFSLLSN